MNANPNDPRSARLVPVVMGISLAASALMLGGKFAAYWVSGSAAILSDAAESLIHGVATGFAAYSLWYSRRPADATHTYGHGKIAYFSAGFEGALIFGASVVIIATAVWQLIHGVELHDLGLGILITGFLALVNLALGLSLVLVGRRQHVLILVANGKHVLSDMWTSLGVVIGVTIVWATGIVWLDPVVAMLVGANIGWTGIQLMRKSVAGLLDEADPSVVRGVLACLDEAQSGGEITGYHQLRLRHSDAVLWIEVHMMVCSEMTIAEGHARVTAIEERLRKRFAPSPLHITTHIEPDDHHEAHPHGHAGVNDFLEGPAVGAADRTGREERT